MQRYGSAEVVEREKQGFSAPDAISCERESIDYVHHKLFNDRRKICEFLDRRVVQNLVNAHLEGKQERRLLVWSLFDDEE